MAPDHTANIINEMRTSVYRDLLASVLKIDYEPDHDSSTTSPAERLLRKSSLIVNQPCVSVAFMLFGAWVPMLILRSNQCE